MRVLPISPEPDELVVASVSVASGGFERSCVLASTRKAVLAGCFPRGADEAVTTPFGSIPLWRALEAEETLGAWRDCVFALATDACERLDPALGLPPGTSFESSLHQFSLYGYERTLSGNPDFELDPFARTLLENGDENYAAEIFVRFPPGTRLPLLEACSDALFSGLARLAGSEFGACVVLSGRGFDYDDPGIMAHAAAVSAALRDAGSRFMERTELASALPGSASERHAAPL